MQNSRVDISFHPESRCQDRAWLSYIKDRHKVKQVSCFRPPPAPGQAQQGGLTVICWKSSLCIRDLRHDSKGLLSVEVRRPGYKPISVIALYIPHSRSPQEEWTPHLLSCMVTEYQRLVAIYGASNTIITGDFNIRLGDWEGRRFSVGAAAPSVNQRYRLLSDALHRISCSPIHGRQRASRAHTTSRNPNSEGGGETEIDFFVMSDDVNATPVKPPDWSTLPLGITHRPVLMRLTLTPQANGFRAVPKLGTAPRLPPIPNYDDDRHRQMAIALTKEFDAKQLLDSAAADPLTAPEMLYRFCSSVSTAAADVYPSAPDQVPPSEGGRPCVPVQGVYKTCNGQRVPPALAAMLQQRTRLHCDLIRIGRVHGRKSAQARVAKDIVRACEKHIRQTQRRHFADVERKRRQLAEHLRCKNAYSWIRLVKRLSAQQTSIARSDEGFKPTEPGAVPAVTAFTDHFRQQYGTLRPVPPGIADTQWHKFIPSAEAGTLWSAPISWQEVYLLLYPAHKEVMPDDVCPGVGDSCALCQQYKDKMAVWVGNGCNPDNNTGDLPHYTPHLHTSVSGGPDGIRAEMLAWARPAEGDSTLSFRTSVCRILAQLYEKIRISGEMPEGSTLNRTIALLKVAKPGAPAMNPADPKDHRGITMGDTISKLFGLVICKRLMHWVVQHNIISPQQVGFMQGKGCEDHVFALLETVRSQWRSNEPAYVLFVDIAKAYDSVNPEALWFVLKRMGLPPQLVSLLADWSSKRMTQVHINGETSEPFNMLLGLGQGDILSPLLYNLFTEPLTRFILQVASTPDSGYEGINVMGVLMTELKYADDSALVSRTLHGIRRIALAFYYWCKAWGLDISFDKTEAMALFPPGSADRLLQDGPNGHPALLPVSVGSGQQVIKWVKQYKYLGLLLTHDLDFSSVYTDIVSKVQGSWQRYFVLSSHARRSSPAMVLQLFRTLVMACCNYLCCLLDPDKGFCRKIDALSLQVARMALRAPSGTPAFILRAESRLMPMQALMYRERYRLLHKYSLATQAPHRQQDIAVRLFAAVSMGISQGLPVGGTPLRPQTCSWVRRALYLNGTINNVLLSQGITLLTPPIYTAVSQYAARMARSVAVTLWRVERDESLKSSKTSIPILLQQTLHGDDPSCTSPTMTSSALYGLDTGRTDVSFFPRLCTSLSEFGPGCSGGILALDTEQRHPRRWEVLMTLRLGTAGLYTQFFGEDWRQGKRWLDGYRDRHIAIKCARCGDRSQSPYHVLLRCTHAAVANTRARVLAAPAVERILCSLVHELLRAEYEHGLSVEEREVKRDELAVRRDELQQSITTCVSSINAADLSTAHCFLLYRLMAVTPWTFSLASMCRDSDVSIGAADTWSAICALGELFDNTQRKPNMLRAIARTWIGWASSAVLSLAHAWKHRASSSDTPPPSETSSERSYDDLRAVPLPHSSLTRILASMQDVSSDGSTYTADSSVSDSDIESVDEGLDFDELEH